MTALRDAGRDREALTWVERVLSGGPSGAERGLALAFGAQLRMNAGDLSPRIETQLEESLALVPPSDRAVALSELGRFQRQSGRLADAARTLEASVNDAIAVHATEDHPDVAASLHALAIVLHAQGDLDHWSSAVTEEFLAAVLVQQGDKNDRPRAAELLVHAYVTYQSQLGDDHPKTRGLAKLFGRGP